MSTDQIQTSTYFHSVNEVMKKCLFSLIHCHKNNKYNDKYEFTNEELTASIDQQYILIWCIKISTWWIGTILAKNQFHSQICFLRVSTFPAFIYFLTIRDIIHTLTKICDCHIQLTSFIYPKSQISWVYLATLPTMFTSSNCTGKSLSEALIFVSTNPQYDNRLFIELQVKYTKIPSSNLGTMGF